MADSGQVRSLGPRLETVDGWAWVTAPASSLGAVVGGTAQEAIDATGARWIGCGPMFDSRGPEYLVRDSVTGTDHPSRFGQRGVTVCVGADGRAAAHLGVAAVGCRVAVQGYPALVYRGRSVSVAESERARRVALAVVDDHQVALVGGYGTMGELVTVCRARRVRAAVYLDGGRAAHLAGRGETVWEHTESERPAAWIVLR